MEFGKHVIFYLIIFTDRIYILLDEQIDGKMRHMSGYMRHLVYMRHMSGLITYSYYLFFISLPHVNKSLPQDTSHSDKLASRYQKMLCHSYNFVSRGNEILSCFK